MLNSPMLSIFQHFHAIPLRSPLISLRSKWRLTGFSRRFTPKNPVRLHNPFGQLPRWGAKNVLLLNLITLHSRGRGTASAALGCFRKQHKCTSLSPILPSVFHAIVTLSAPAGHLPLEGKAAIRKYHPLKRRHTTLVNLSAPPYRHPERSRGIFIALPPYAHMRPHSNDTLVLPFSPFPRSRSTGLQERSLHFGPHDRWKTDSLT